MKKTVRFLGLVAFAAIIGFTLTACGNDAASAGSGTITISIGSSTGAAVSASGWILGVAPNLLAHTITIIDGEGIRHEQTGVRYGSVVSFAVAGGPSLIGVWAFYGGDVVAYGYTTYNVTPGRSAVPIHMGTPEGAPPVGQPGPRTGTPPGTHNINIVIERSSGITICANHPPTAVAVATPNSAAHNAMVTLSVVLGQWYTFDVWEVLSGAVTLSNPTAGATTFIMPNSDVTLVARFAPVGSLGVDFSWAPTPSPGTISINGYSGPGGNVEIPQYMIIGGIPHLVIDIAANAFHPFPLGNNTGGLLTSVYIPSSVTSIGAMAFQDNNLTSVTIPNSVTSIEPQAFMNNNLTSVTIPNSVTSIGSHAFTNNNLTSVTIPNSVTSIGMNAFQNNNLTNVTIPNSVTSIEFATFAGNNLTSVTIPNSVTSIWDNAFANNNLTSVTIPNSVTNIGIAAFAVNNLTSVTIPNSVTSIGATAFLDNNLTSVTIPNSVTFIWQSAFANNNLTSVTIPDSVTFIHDSTFMNNNLTSVVIPNSVTAIWPNAFANNNLTSVTIPNSVTSIGSGAFMDNNLTTVTIPNSVTFIDANAFFNNNLTSITIIGAGVTLGIDAIGDGFEALYLIHGAGSYSRPNTASPWTYTP